MTTLRIGIVAGEASGDILGADLMRAIKARHPEVRFEGIGGPLMLEEGFDSHFPMDRLSVMGFVDPLLRLPELLRIRKAIKQHFTTHPPDLFLGIDSPDFTLNIERALREQGILTAHYVSPSVWAWRQGRVKNIARAVDRMLTLLPFEADFYLQHNVPVTFVGHPLADRFTLDDDTLAGEQQAARRELGLSEDDVVVALLPGSRGGEVKLLAPSFIETARWCLHQQPGIRFVMPAAGAARYEQLQQLMQKHGKGLPIQLLEGRSREAMTAANAVLMASGTTTLEALLLKKPMVVAYRLNTLTYWIASRMVKSPFFSLPNLLAGEAVVPEILQRDVRPEMLGPLVLDRLDPREQQPLKQRFRAIHTDLRRGASDRAAEVLLTMIEKRPASDPVRAGR